ncbi:uncharacterized protein LOC142501634 [Ascaphus truei]|uniref:uncharacterized protein LOC142501634 n=1 Tax=Ascaphus truei TaxID=8439 RepID=UPI003F5A40C6
MKYLILLSLLIDGWAHSLDRQGNRVLGKAQPGAPPPAVRPRSGPDLDLSVPHSHPLLNITGIPQNVNSSHALHENHINGTEQYFHKGLYDSSNKPRGQHRRSVQNVFNILGNEHRLTPPNKGNPPPHLPLARSFPSSFPKNPTHYLEGNQPRPFRATANYTGRSHNDNNLENRPKKPNYAGGDNHRPKRASHSDQGAKEGHGSIPTGVAHYTEKHVRDVPTHKRPQKPTSPYLSIKGIQHPGGSPNENHGPPQGKKPR